MDLYRGKAKTTGDWIVGAAVVIGEKAHILGSESLFPERPAYHGMAIGCGLEDACITDRYEAAAYGWTEALDKYEENFPRWIELEPETVTRCTNRHDILGNVLFEGDVFRDQEGVLFEICYGRYLTNQRGNCFLDNVGFFLVTRDKRRFRGKYISENVCPLGTTEQEAYLVGNIFDNPELCQSVGEDSGEEADQLALMPAT